jgi:hypothetical protein
LENLRVRRNIFENAKLPFKVKFGKIKKLQIIVPWTRLQSSPVEIILETLMMVVNPQNADEWTYFDSQSLENK